MSDAFVDVDLHDMTTDEARIEIKRALKTVSKFTYQIRLIHGFNRGTRIKKMISEEWNISKQTVNTILKDFQKKGYINMVSDDSDKRNKLICLTESGMEYTKDIIEKLHSKEIYVIEKMGLENIESLNDNTELFIRLFKEGDCKKNES